MEASYACVCTLENLAWYSLPFWTPGHVLLLRLPLRGALHFPHQRPFVGRRHGWSHLHVLSKSRDVYLLVSLWYLISIEVTDAAWLRLVGGNLGECASVASGGHPSLFCPGTWLWLRDRIFLLQPGAQQLPQGRHHGLWHQLHDVSVGHASGFRHPGVPCQDYCVTLCGQVRKHICISPIIIYEFECLN